MAYVNLPVDKVREYCEEIYRRHGFNDEECRCIVDVILTADLYGIESHGIQRMIRYHNSLVRNLVDPKASPTIIHETKLSAVIDGNRTMGQTTAAFAMKMAISKAKEHGFGAVTVRNCNHYGIAGYYAKMAANEDLIGFSSTNTEAIALPTFGKKPMLGTTPLALSMPAEPYDFLYDVATTVVVTFPIAFTGTPTVFLTPVTGVPENMAVGVVRSGDLVPDPKKAVGVTLTRSGLTSTGVNWFAIGKGT